MAFLNNFLVVALGSSLTIVYKGLYPQSWAIRGIQYTVKWYFQKYGYR